MKKKDKKKNKDLHLIPDLSLRWSGTYLEERPEISTYQLVKLSDWLLSMTSRWLISLISWLARGELWCHYTRLSWLARMRKPIDDAQVVKGLSLVAGWNSAAVKPRDWLNGRVWMMSQDLPYIQKRWQNTFNNAFYHVALFKADNACLSNMRTIVCQSQQGCQLRV